jgi:hypothetical protein
MHNGLLNFSYGAAEELAAQSVSVLAGLALNTYSPGITDLAMGALALGQASWDLSSLAYHTWTGQYARTEEAPWQKTASSILKLSTGCALIARACGRAPYSDTVLGVSLIANASLALFRLGQNTYNELFLEQEEMQWKRAGRFFVGGVLASHSLAQGNRLLSAGKNELTSPRSRSTETVYGRRVPKLCEDAINELRKKWPHDHPTCREKPSFTEFFSQTDLLYASDDRLYCRIESIRRLSSYLSGEEICLAYNARKLGSRYAWTLDSPLQSGDKVAVVTRAISDWNGAFRTKSLDEKLGPGIDTLYKSARVTAAYTKNMADVCSALHTAADRHGKKIDTLVISAHGYPYALVLGDRGHINLFTDISCLDRYLSENATVVLDSCATAWEGGFSRLNIAKWMALSAPGRTVVGTPYLSNSKRLHLSGDQWQFRYGSEDCAVKYRYRSGVEHRHIYRYASTSGIDSARLTDKNLSREDFVRG